MLGILVESRLENAKHFGIVVPRCDWEVLVLDRHEAKQAVGTLAILG
jgi:hypothetical protein